MYRVFGMSTSGNCHKVRLVLENLRLPYEWVEVDTTKDETRTAGFLAMNPNGRVPTFDLSRYPRINAWLARIKSQPGYVEMPSPVSY